MAYREKFLVAQISAETLSGSLNAETPMSGTLRMAKSTTERDYEKLHNKPKINGVELISDKSFEELGVSPMTNSEILEIIKLVKGR